MNIKLLALDMDGTVLCDDHATIIPENRAAIKAAIAKGIAVVTATGRVRGRIPDQMAAIPGQRFLITSNGAVLTELSGDKILYSNPLARDTALSVLAALDGLELYMEAYCNGLPYAETCRAHLLEQFPVSPGRRAMMSRGVQFVESLCNHISQDQVALEKINLPYLPDSAQKEIIARLSKVQSISLTSSVEKNIEINNASANKGAALSYLCHYLGITPAETMAMGDGGNDVEMLRFAGVSATPANASGAAKQAAKFITFATNNEGAVAEAIKKFIL